MSHAPLSHPAITLPYPTPSGRGASWVERHITMDREAWGSDQKSSISQQIKNLLDSKIFLSIVEALIFYFRKIKNIKKHLIFFNGKTK